MDTPVLFALVAGVVIVLFLLLRPLRRRSRDLGSRLGEGLTKRMFAGKMPGILANLGATLDFAAPAEDVDPVVTKALAADPQAAVPIGHGRWNLRAVIGENDDAVLALTRTEAGSRLAIESSRDERGFPQGGPRWQELIGTVERAAREAGIAVTRGSITHVRTPYTTGTRWMPERT
ncbi:hypothetical protein [Georgenia alba]|uniref:Uncharacterized protein n=1 Tax=Georgenia alba TaxID=2233858 RepID=A0ABW2Q7U3_9MICO